MGHQLGGVVLEMTVRIIQGMRISEGQIIRAILYLMMSLNLIKLQVLAGCPFL